MEVVKYLKQHGIDRLKEEFSIVVRDYPEEGLYVLNYNMVDSPKMHPIVIECRGLILDHHFNVVSRSFDRFFNWGEAEEITKKIDINSLECIEKIDGSLIKIYFWRNKWHISTRGSAFAEVTTNEGHVFRDLVLKALNMDDISFQCSMRNLMLTDYTLICELVCPENRVVKKYDNYELYFLGLRLNKTGEYREELMYGMDKILKLPKKYKLSCINDIIKSSKELTGLDEGFVCICKKTGIRVKIKSPLYVAVHYIRGNGINTKRALNLIFENQHLEYLTYFPEDDKVFKDSFNAVSSILMEADNLREKNKHLDGKIFADEVKHHKASFLIFSAKRNGTTTTEEFNKLDINKKMNACKKWLNI